MNHCKQNSEQKQKAARCCRLLRKARADLDPRLLSWDGTRERCLRPRVELGGQSVHVSVAAAFLQG
jgi:hypothetical protein